MQKKHDIPSNVLAGKLIERGWLPDSGVKNATAIVKAVRGFQRGSGLKVDGQCGPVTKRNLFAWRLCGVPDAMGRGVCKWPTKNVAGAMQGEMPGISASDLKAAYAWAWEQWSIVCGIKPQYSSNARTANVLMTPANLGGPYGVLADSQVPCSATQTSQLQQRYDTSEPWHAEPGPPARGRISLPTVACHEVGRAIGIFHIGNGVALMNPTYNPEVLTPQPADVQEANDKRYGPPDVSTPDPVPKNDVWTIEGEFVLAARPVIKRNGQAARVLV